MKTIYFARHAESESNVAGILSGGGTDIPLTKAGRLQAKETGRTLKKKGVQLVVCSPLIRTVETATIIAEEIGYDSNRIVTNPVLTERAYGIYEGRPLPVYDQDYENGKVHESVETTEELHRRMHEALEWLRSLDADTIIVVSHSGTSRAIRAINQDLHHSRMYTDLERLPNAGVYEFTL